MKQVLPMLSSPEHPGGNIVLESRGVVAAAALTRDAGVSTLTASASASAVDAAYPEPTV